MRILSGSIVSQEVDAIVSSDDESLSMGGGVSAAIARSAGWEVRKEAERYTPVRHGRAVVTSAGQLPARFVFHGVTLDFRRADGLPSRDVIAEIIDSCFYHAETLNVRSIALPLLGTGRGGFAEDICLDTMFRTLARFMISRATSVREARIVLFPTTRRR